MTNDSLRERIESFEFDSGQPELTFTQRLARENNWSVRYSNAAVKEYLRFVYLCCVHEKPLTPSDAVDQVWHLHLTYSSSYWEDFCKDTLGRPLHHQPTRGGKEEREKYAAWYDRTLKVYEHVFGNRPPLKVWPHVSVRFRDVESYKRINTAENLVVRKWVLVVTAAFVLFLLGATWLQAQASWLGESTGFVTAIFGLVILVYVVSWLVKRQLGGGSGTGGCSVGGGNGGGGCGG